MKTSATHIEGFAHNSNPVLAISLVFSNIFLQEVNFEIKSCLLLGNGLSIGTAVLLLVYIATGTVILTSFKHKLFSRSCCRS